MLEDRFGQPLSATSAAAAALYVEAVDLLTSSNLGAGNKLAQALDLDGDFALAHAARARQLQLAGALPEAAAAAAEARRLAAAGSAREQSHAKIIELAVSGQGAAAYGVLRAHMTEHPRDALVLSLALGVYGLIGFSGRLEHHREQRELLEGLAPNWDDDWWFDGYLGWSRVETGDPADGIPLLDRSLAANAANANAAHARAHGYYELGDAAGGAAFIKSWLPGYDRQSPLHCHIAWHWALFELQDGDEAAALAIYDGNIRPAVAQSPPMFTMIDAAAFTWRRLAYGFPVPEADRREVADYAGAHFPRAGVGFVDTHCAIAYAAAADEDALGEQLDRIGALLDQGKLATGPVVRGLCDGIAAFCRRDYAVAATLLALAVPEMDRLGGSHAQRDIFTDTLIAAHARAGQPELAQSVMAARAAERAGHLDAAWLARLSPA